VAGRRVLVTGVSSYLGTELARRLERDPEVEYVAGVDTRPPTSRLERVDFIEADIRSPLLLRLLPHADVDTVIHNKIVRRAGAGLSPQAAHDTNVIGTLQLLAACERTPGLETIVVRGSAGIYGAEPGAPTFFTEEAARLFPLRTRFQRDVGEIESLFEAFSRRHPGVTCTMLRYQPAIGPKLDAQITRLLSMPVVPTYLGFDPRLQFVHAVDAVEATVAAMKQPVDGPVNVAGPGTIGLSRLLRRTGRAKLALPERLFGSVTSVGRRFGGVDLSPDFVRLLRYGRAVDTTRLVREVGFRPRHSTADAVEDYIRARGGLRPLAALARPVTG
jgi:UDP-glucose 4-epimerase